MIAHIILAAGAGTRVGMPKGLLPLGGIPLLQRIINESTRGGDFSIIVVTGAQSTDVAMVAQQLALPRVSLRENTCWATGQTSSIRAGLAGLASAVDAFFIHPVDHALVQAAHLRLLAEAWHLNPEPQRIYRPVFQGAWGHPVLFGVTYAREFLALRDDEPGHTIYRRHREMVVGVPMPDDACNFDLDTPEDLVAAARRLSL